MQSVGIASLDIEACQAVSVGPGCTRRDLLRSPGVHVWSVDIAANAEWPHVDRHDALGEYLFVARGELIEGDRRYPAGTFIHYGPDSAHRPRSETGVRLYGFNLVAG